MEADATMEVDHTTSQAQGSVQVTVYDVDGLRLDTLYFRLPKTAERLKQQLEPDFGTEYRYHITEEDDTTRLDWDELLRANVKYECRLKEKGLGAAGRSKEETCAALVRRFAALCFKLLPADICTENIPYAVDNNASAPSSLWRDRFKSGLFAALGELHSWFVHYGNPRWVGYGDYPKIYITETPQVLRVTCTCGSGKTTSTPQLLLDVWRELYSSLDSLRSSYERYSKSKSSAFTDACMQRLKRMLNPNCGLVFYHNLSETGDGELLDIEKRLPMKNILALRLLFSSLNHEGDYANFLHKMKTLKLLDIQPLDVLHFWKQVAGYQDEEEWGFVFQIDERRANSTQPKARTEAIGTTSDDSAWTERFLAECVLLRKEAMQQSRYKSMRCLPVVVIVSTVGKTSSPLKVTSERLKMLDIALNDAGLDEVLCVFPDRF